MFFSNCSDQCHQVHNEHNVVNCYFRLAFGSLKNCFHQIIFNCTTHVSICHILRGTGDSNAMLFSISTSFPFRDDIDSSFPRMSLLTYIALVILFLEIDMRFVASSNNWIWFLVNGFTRRLVLNSSYFSLPVVGTERTCSDIAADNSTPELILINTPLSTSKPNGLIYSSLNTYGTDPNNLINSRHV